MIKKTINIDADDINKSVVFPTDSDGLCQILNRESREMVAYYLQGNFMKAIREGLAISNKVDLTFKMTVKQRKRDKQLTITW